MHDSSVSFMVSVNLHAKYENKISQLHPNEYFFSYIVTIHNQSGITLQLTKRQWHIIDLALGSKTVKGEGVIGEKPIIQNNTSYQYSSFCFLRSPIGTIKGSYSMVDISSKKSYTIPVLSTLLYIPQRLN